jgi:DNA-binding MarR family transcriptional regulator
MDRVDAIIAQWARECPDLDVAGMAVIGRVSRLAEIFGDAHSEVFQRYGLDRGEFDVLATLRRAGEPFRLSPSALVRSLMMSSGGMTSRLDRLEAAGLVRRHPDPRDRRGVQVELTPEGLARVDEALSAHVQNQRKLLAGLPPLRQQELARTLRQLLLALEGGPEDEGA